MLYSALTPSAKRRVLRERLASGELLELPGAFNPLAARLIEDKGFDGVYLSGAVVAADLGLPDVGLTTLTEVANRAAQVARVTDLPTLVDADTGFGEAMNAARTVQALEDAGVAGLHLEDQVNPKRCGHLDGKQVVDEATAVQRVRAAASARRDPDLLIMARTDASAVLGLDAALDRARALVDAGADAIFPEALQGLDELERFAAELPVPVLANMTEFGKTKLFTRQQLSDAGAAVVIYPVSLLRIAMGGAERALDALRAEGSLRSQVPHMQSRTRLYDLLDYAGYAAFDAGVYDFTLREDQ